MLETDGTLIICLLTLTCIQYNNVITSLLFASSVDFNKSLLTIELIFELFAD
jgi:hypothetical protein